MSQSHLSIASGLPMPSLHLCSALVCHRLDKPFKRAQDLKSHITRFHTSDRVPNIKSVAKPIVSAPAPVVASFRTIKEILSNISSASKPIAPVVVQNRQKRVNKNSVPSQSINELLQKQTKKPQNVPCIHCNKQFTSPQLLARHVTAVNRKLGKQQKELLVPSKPSVPIVLIDESIFAIDPVIIAQRLAVSDIKPIVMSQEEEYVELLEIHMNPHIQSIFAVDPVTEIVNPTLVSQEEESVKLLKIQITNHINCDPQFINLYSMEISNKIDLEIELREKQFENKQKEIHMKTVIIPALLEKARQKAENDEWQSQFELTFANYVGFDMIVKPEPHKQENTIEFNLEPAKIFGLMSPTTEFKTQIIEQSKPTSIIQEFPVDLVSQTKTISKPIILDAPCLRLKKYLEPEITQKPQRHIIETPLDNETYQQFEKQILEQRVGRNNIKKEKQKLYECWKQIVKHNLLETRINIREDYANIVKSCLTIQWLCNRSNNVLKAKAANKENKIMKIYKNKYREIVRYYQRQVKLIYARDYPEVRYNVLGYPAPGLDHQAETMMIMYTNGDEEQFKFADYKKPETYSQEQIRLVCDSLLQRYIEPSAKRRGIVKPNSIIE